MMIKLAPFSRKFERYISHHQRNTHSATSESKLTGQNEDGKEREEEDEKE